MSDYIERSVIERLLTIAAAGDGDKKCRTWAKAICVLHDAPTVDAAPVRHGQWRLYGVDKRGRGGVWMCTGCKGSFPYKSRYFPNCGAKMDGGDDDD